ncbi:DinB family protein [Niabella aquatica]
MTKEYFKELAAYNIWANSIACEWIEQIHDSQWNKMIASSFSSIRETVLHIISAENAWLQRFHKKVNVEWIQSTFMGTKDDHIALWKQTSMGIKDFIDAFDEKELNARLDFKRFNGDAYSMPYYQLFAHVVNHATYHRGQLVTMLRQAEYTNVSSTDLLAYYR